MYFIITVCFLTYYIRSIWDYYEILVFSNLVLVIIVDYLNHLPAESEDRENVESKNTVVFIALSFMFIIFLQILLLWLYLCL